LVDLLVLTDWLTDWFQYVVFVIVCVAFKPVFSRHSTHKRYSWLVYLIHLKGHLDENTPIFESLIIQIFEDNMTQLWLWKPDWQQF
jgi:hypothetical protein